VPAVSAMGENLETIRQTPPLDDTNQEVSANMNSTLGDELEAIHQIPPLDNANQRAGPSTPPRTIISNVFGTSTATGSPSVPTHIATSAFFRTHPFEASGNPFFSRVPGPVSPRSEAVISTHAGQISVVESSLAHKDLIASPPPRVARKTVGLESSKPPESTEKESGKGKKKPQVMKAPGKGKKRVEMPIPDGGAKMGDNVGRGNTQKKPKAGNGKAAGDRLAVGDMQVAEGNAGPNAVQFPSRPQRHASASAKVLADRAQQQEAEEKRVAEEKAKETRRKEREKRAREKIRR
jgi:hypothetical protein